MPVAALILVETSSAGNLGAALRVAANFSVPRLELVRPGVAPEDPEVLRWACGASSRLEIRSHDTFAGATAPYRVLVATASGRGRERQPVVDPRSAAATLAERGLDRAALVFGNETSGLSREHLDRCDLAVRVPTDPEFPVLNITQSIAILLAYLSLAGEAPTEHGPPPATQEEVEGLMGHLQAALLDIGFLDPVNPRRILRKLRRLLGRAAVTTNEVAILHGACRQMQWAARTGPLRQSESED